ncbi:hypothetical protein Pyn_40822 [Prunus yedoensis var. nudiflora]|uniref:Uncharacterized protein n=1 Tax=Prunus yedoensis var. nudiflora TaxID=2094558 RepID=A0A314YPM4_PRUYE|nr:hypothetical protein Pyn_40822 [Prunus yedoensis var. nudiflora]
MSSLHPWEMLREESDCRVASQDKVREAAAPCIAVHTLLSSMEWAAGRKLKDSFIFLEASPSSHRPTPQMVCHVCFVCCVGGNLKHCGKCLQSYHLQCLDKPHTEKKHIEVSGTRQIPIKTVLTSLDEVPSQRDAYGNKSSGKKVGSSSNANAGALVDDNNVGGRLVSHLVMNFAVITADFVRQKSTSAAASFERKSSSECDEEKISDLFRPVTTQPVAAASIASGQRRNSSVGRQK